MFVGLRLSLLLVLPHSGRAAPLYLDLPFNADIVREPGGTVTASLGFAGEALVSQNEAAANDSVDPHGLPDDGRFSTPGAMIQFGPYNGNNALKMGPGQGSPFIPVPPAQYTDLHVFAVASDGFRTDANHVPPGIVRTSNPVTLNAFLSIPNHATGHVSASVTNYLEESDSYLIDGMDTTGANGLGYLDIDDAAIFHYHIPLIGATSIPSVNMIRFTNEFALTESLFIVGAYLEVPEPGSIALLMLGSLLLVRYRKTCQANSEFLRCST